MAPVGHVMALQSSTLEARIKTLLNNDLRAICRAYGQVVSGTKVALQARCITVLKSIVAKGDLTQLNEFSGRVNNHGNLQPTAPVPAASTASSRPGYSSGMPGSNPAAPRPQFTSTTKLEFKNSPFYERQDIVLRAQDLPEMPQNRHTVKANLVLTEDQARRLSSDSEQYRLMVYCAQPGLYTACDIAFPPQIEIKVNEDDVKANFKGLKNKPGSTKPADITRMVRLRAGYPNKLSVCYALTTKRYSYAVYLVRYINTDTLVQKIRTNRVFPKQRVLEDIQRLNNDPDIAATSTKMSLKDPISTSRITVPIRSAFCSHNQCFDASFFLQLQEQAPTWQCPLCNRFVTFESLSVDKYFEEILQTTSRTTEQVTIEPNGEWRVVRDDNEGNGTSNAAKGAARASYDDDFDDDDDLIELDAKAAVKKEPNQAALNAFSTPPLSSREPSVAQSHTQASNKRPSAVIDLTLSDDDDEPIRPNKRTRLDGPTSRPQPHIQTPSSIPDASGAKQQNSSDSAQSAHQMAAYESMLAPFKSPAGLSLFQQGNAASASVFGSHSELSARPSSQLGTSTNAFPSSWANFRSPSLPYTDTELYRRLSVSRSPSHTNAMPWPTNSNTNTSSTDAQQSGLPTYRTFTQDQPSRPSTSNAFLPNGWGGGSASPG